MKAAYITADTLGVGGGGLLAKNEIAALRSVVDQVVVLDSSELAPARFHQPESVFLYDYFALQEVRRQHLDFAHFYSGTFTQTVAWLKSNGVPVSYCVPAHDRKMTIEEFQRLGLEYPWHHIKDDDLWKIFSEGYRLADMVIAQSKSSAEFLRREGCSNVTVIHGGCDLPERVEPIRERFDVGYLGQAGPDKGLVYLIQAWATLNYQDSRLVIAGRGTEGIEPFVRQIADRGQFVILGPIDTPSRLYNACSVYVQPSVVEAYALEVPEAMAHGRPVIVTEGVGAKDIVEEGETGFIVPIRSPQAIAEKIDFLENHPDELRRMGANARERARDYTWSKVRSRYAEAFSSLLSAGTL